MDGDPEAGRCDVGGGLDPDGLVGERVSLRRRVGVRDGRPLYSDAVGELAAEGPDLVVRTRRGPVRVARADVVAVRAVPPAVPRRPSWAAVARLENLCADAWPAAVDEPLGAWRLRAAGGCTGRANGALATGDPATPVPDALAAVEAFAARHGIAPRVQVAQGSPWETAVRRAGWVPDTGHAAGAEVAVLVADLATVAGAAAGRGSPGGTADRPDAAGQVTGVIHAVVVEDHLHLDRLAAVEAHRRTALTRAAAAWGLARGARYAVAQVAVHDTAGHALHAALGFVEHHRYVRLRPS